MVPKEEREEEGARRRRGVGGWEGGWEEQEGPNKPSKNETKRIE